jgi:hypothetical protein
MVNPILQNTNKIITIHTHHTCGGKLDDGDGGGDGTLNLRAGTDGLRMLMGLKGRGVSKGRRI